jgi:hypothetical protein
MCIRGASFLQHDLHYFGLIILLDFFQRISSRYIDKTETLEEYQMLSPFLQAIPELSVIASEDNNEVGPSFRKGFACVPIENDATLGGQWFQLIQ